MIYQGMVHTYFNYRPQPNTKWFEIKEDAELFAKEQVERDNVDEVHVFVLLSRFVTKIPYAGEV